MKRSGEAGAQEREEEVAGYGRGTAPGNFLIVDQSRMTFAFVVLPVNRAAVPYIVKWHYVMFPLSSPYPNILTITL